ncbi:DUF4180 domain-containing protein [Caproiciproducens sp. CPB-2]|uniref:DUF4180 domain-containing protein n=1 Tax=Caproiciproducens sp. CPB-2 TaxID=3030017 RepID=UPI0023DC493A|nr:DUF4180 domain-containing protein [Caproiciproducens sp. CPB-2]MDF1495607.1 DUF4180 domain-containing protein [Caproiciproducens sp. CPB-2]
MNTQIKEKNGVKIAVVNSGETLISDGQSALDWMMSVQYETGCSRIALNKEAIADDFFILSSGVAGEILQKFINYHIKFAVYGDFSKYTSKPLRDFIYESNQGRDIFFVPTEEDAAEKLGGVSL